ncbi:NADPH-dependent F420 reductase [Nonomuraea dietziae]|jgi:predicted dinucleotide-binding enzyme|uniref:NADPH-dependent F420 reductase n=1 Tax=Nonomuraea dietziae TaxID=65515 RepID=UPI003417C542
MAEQARRPRGPTLGVVGCGAMGTAVAELLGHGGFPVLLAGGRRRTADRLASTIPGAAAAPLETVAHEAQLVILATSLDVSQREIVPRIHGHLAGKVVVDVSNPTPADLSASAHDSAGEMLAELLPKSPIVKALNCVSARRLRMLAHGGPAPTVPIAGDDLAAKQCVTYVLRRLGLDVADAGPLCHSKWIEGLAELLRRLGSEEGLGDAVGFRLLRLDQVDRTPAGRAAIVPADRYEFGKE